MKRKIDLDKVLAGIVDEIKRELEKYRRLKRDEAVEFILSKRMCKRILRYNCNRENIESLVDAILDHFDIGSALVHHDRAVICIKEK